MSRTSRCIETFKKTLLYGDFLLAIRSTSSKLFYLLLIMFANQAQHLPISYDYFSSIQIPQPQSIMEKLWTALITFIADYHDRPIVNKILDYTVSSFSESVLDQLADKTLIPIDFDDYLRVFDDTEVEEEVVEEYKKSTVVAENAFKALL